MRRVALVYIFANLFRVWLYRKQLASHVCSGVQNAGLVERTKHPSPTDMQLEEGGVTTALSGNWASLVFHQNSPRGGKGSLLWSPQPPQWGCRIHEWLSGLSDSETSFIAHLEITGHELRRSSSGDSIRHMY